MKRITVVALALTALVPLLLSGCAVVSPASTSGGPSEPVVSQGISLTADDFAADPHPVRDVTLDRPGSLTVNLAANPTTGYSWSENATISAPVVSQQSYAYIQPTSDAVGAPGTSAWVFEAQQTGFGTITFSYARPWESVPPTWTLTVNVTVE